MTALPVCNLQQKSLKVVDIEQKNRLLFLSSSSLEVITFPLILNMEVYERNKREKNFARTLRESDIIPSPTWKTTRDSAHHSFDSAQLIQRTLEY